MPISPRSSRWPPTPAVCLPGKMMYIHFALGKALEDVGDYPRAFEHLLQGNALKRREIDYDEAGCQRDFPAHRRACSTPACSIAFRRRAIPRRRRSSSLGMPRSGSTLVEQILASHPQVHAAGELKNLDRVVQIGVRRRRPAASVSASASRRSTPTACGGWGRPIWPACRRLPSGKTRITDKMPNNFVYRRFDPPDPAQCPDHPHGARSGRYLRFVFLAALCSGLRSAMTWPSWAAITAGITS